MKRSNGIQPPAAAMSCRRWASRAADTLPGSVSRIGVIVESMTSRPVVLVTGAARRVGRAMALDLAGHGFDVAVHYRGSADEAQATARDCADLGARAQTFQADLSDESAARALLPAVVQDAATLRMLMLGYMDRAALEATLASGKVTFFSRSRQRQWTKGERSGHVLELVSVEADCDRDTLLVLAHPRGPTCHLETQSCFAAAPGDALAELDALLAERVRLRPAGSYTTSLLDAGLPRIAQKVGEEGVEAALAAVTGSEGELAEEAADLLYHLLLLLRARGLDFTAAKQVLAARAARPL